MLEYRFQSIFFNDRRQANAYTDRYYADLALCQLGALGHPAKRCTVNRMKTLVKSSAASMCCFFKQGILPSLHHSTQLYE